MLSKIWNTIRRLFLSGLLVIVPLIITYVVLRFLFISVDGILAPLLGEMRIWGHQIPGMGILVSILLILLAGFLTRGVIGRRAVGLWERFLTTLPLVRTIYSAAKQLLVSVAGPQEEAFERVVIIPYPRRGVYAFAFAARPVTMDRSGIEGYYVAVFVPSTPTPFTGFVVMVNKNDIYPTKISVEEAVKFLVSGGMAVPDSMLPAQLKDQQTV